MPEGLLVTKGQLKATIVDQTGNLVWHTVLTFKFLLVSQLVIPTLPST